jgi:Kelch motif
VIIFGGQNEVVPRAFFDDVWRYNYITNKWTQDVFVTPSVLLARSAHAGVLVNGNFLFAFNVLLIIFHNLKIHFSSLVGLLELFNK